MLFGECALTLPVVAAEPSPDAILGTYADIALAEYTDALSGAQQLEQTIDAFLAAPTDATLSAARDAYVAARIP